jgi:hypothetical protein
VVAEYISIVSSLTVASTSTFADVTAILTVDVSVNNAYVAPAIRLVHIIIDSNEPAIILPFFMEIPPVNLKKFFSSKKLPPPWSFLTLKDHEEDKVIFN